MGVYKGNLVYRDPADNLSKIKFDVWVSGSYTPVIHGAYLRDGAPPPIYQPDNTENEGVCQSKLTGDFIIAAICEGDKIEFNDMNDCEVLCDWIDQFEKSYEGIDLTMYPDRAAYLKNATHARDVMRGHIRQNDAWKAKVHPKALDVLDILAQL